MTTITLALPETATKDEWMNAGREIMLAHRNAGWLIGDWVKYGKAHFPEQLEMALSEVGLHRQVAQTAERIAQSFPPTERDASLSFDHYRVIAELPHGEARKMLQRFKAERVTPAKAKAIAQQITIPATLIAPNHDTLLISAIHHWNRLPRGVRSAFAERIANAGTDEIEP